jgi:poly-gamma-glutamate capsule biosynthesis protein CapA/YwtB (metallophosphatase superfamily)
VIRARGRAWLLLAAVTTGTTVAATGCATTDAARPAAGTSVQPTASTSPASSPSGATAGSAGPGGGSGGAFTLAATGDLLIHKPVANRALADGGGRHYDFRRMLAKVKPLVAGADLALCHIETPLSKDDRNISGYPVFNTPHELAAAAAWAGYDGCSTASNHSVDRGVAGVSDTLGALDAQHLAHAGTARSASEARRIELHTVKGAEVAHLSYTYGTNGIPVPAAAPWAVNVASVPKILADARRARAAGATFVVVSMHWGQEYQVAPTARQLAQAKALLSSPDVDLILGDHVHVQQPVERIGDKYVVFGMGNLLSNQSPAAGLKPQTQDGGVVRVHVVRSGSRWVADRVTVTATYCQIGPYTVWPVRRALADPATPAALRAALKASLARTRAVYASIPGHHDARVV